MQKYASLKGAFRYSPVHPWSLHCSTRSEPLVHWHNLNPKQVQSQPNNSQSPTSLQSNKQLPKTLINSHMQRKLSSSAQHTESRTCLDHNACYTSIFMRTNSTDLKTHPFSYSRRVYEQVLTWTSSIPHWPTGILETVHQCGEHSRY